MGRFAGELDSILEYFELLEAVDVTGLKPTYQVSGLENVMRDDVVRDLTASADDLLANVPKTEKRYIKVGRMI